MNSIQKRIIARIRKLGEGKIHVSKDFLGLGSRAAVDQTLSRLAARKSVKRLARGLYYIPRINPALGIELAPDMDAIARAVARKTGSRVVPSGAVAANRLGLSTQVPAKPVYLTDGKSRDIRVGGATFTIKHVSPRDLPFGSPASAMVFQALRHIGKDSVTAGTIAHLRKIIPAKDRRKLLKDLWYATGWIAEAARKVCRAAGISGKAQNG
ncbi:MAG: hypothetical protein FD189_2564 [Elusimicrobia bacterium]|nr:MAG: hypothetical protein FD189_2564 [Elusimicrobiota bacterium]